MATLGAALGPATALELRQLRALSRRQAQELDILKKAITSCLLGAQTLADTGPMSHYRFIATKRGHYPVQRLYQVLDVPASDFYAWPARPAADGGEPENAGLGNGVGQGL